MLNIFDSLIEQLNSKYKRWSFVGSIVDFYHFDGQVMIGDIDVVTSDYGELGWAESMLVPPEHLIWRGRNVDVFRGTPSEGMFETPEERIAKLELLAEYYPNRADKCRRVIERYRSGRGAVVGVSGKSKAPKVDETKSCPHRSKDPIRTMTCDICSQGKGKEKPVFACEIFGECTHRQVQHGQSVQICIGCDKGPWPFT